ncbi:SAE1 [Symbiodinium natans]|uniref:SAE1 protein n=1 Tax=Symbiodinium natans TaxID=878477 RepID=A0A812MD82_9DINO|nr:SAE1 [Symbiodinium natans]
MAAITGDQVAVYDRQLRLWGVQAQQRLLNAKVLIWGMEGSNVEACKNLVLAGVSLTLRDHRTVTAADVGFNYFLRPEDLNQSRATCASKRVQEMNPLCTVACNSDRAETGSDEDKLKELVKGFDIVIVGLSVLGYDFELASSVDAACRSLGTGFILTVAAGEMAFFFSDQNEHVMQERSSVQGAESSGPQDPETFSFPPFSHFLSGVPRLLHGKTDASFKLIGLLASFLRSGGKATPSAASDFEAYCRDTVKCEPSVDGKAGMKEAFGHFFVEPLIHVASVLGGLLSQEVIKAITRKDPPLVNSVCFNAYTGAALVELLPEAPPAPKKRKSVEEVADLLDD